MRSKATVVAHRSAGRGTPSQSDPVDMNATACLGLKISILVEGGRLQDSPG